MQASAATAATIGKSRCRSRAFSQQAARAKQQHQDEHQENADLAEGFTEIKPAQALHHADDQAAEQRAGIRAHAAQHDGRERNQHEGIADMRG